MRILISGAAGFLGNWFARHYDVQGNIIDAVDNMQSPYAKMPELRHGWTYRDDIRGFMSFSANKVVQKEYDLFIHLAAPVGGREKIENDPLFNAESLAIDSDVFRWARGRVKTLVYPSSSAVYPVVFQNETYRQPSYLGVKDTDVESNWWGKPDEMYGFTKLAGEVLAHAAAKYGLDTLVLRPFSGYGEGQSQEYPFPTLIRRVARRDDPIEIWGDGQQVRDFIHVEDIVAEVARQVEAGVSGVKTINLGSGVGTSFLELVDKATRIEGYSPSRRLLVDKPVGVQYRVAADSIPMKVSLEEGIKRMLRYEKEQMPQ